MSQPLEILKRAMASQAGELTKLHQSLVAIPTVNAGDGSSANESALAEVAAQYLSGAGIGSRIVEGQPGRGNLLTSLAGSDSANGPSMLWMSHSDVVPPGDESLWKYPPFSAQLAEGRIWGRGANDCKMLVACQLFAISILAREGLLQHGELRLAIGADEEAGGRWGFGWLSENEADFLRTDLAICEGGGSALCGLPGETPMIAVDCGEKGRYEITIEIQGPGGHACVPWRTVNPLTTIGELIARIQAWQPEVATDAPIIAALAHWLEIPQAPSPEQLDAALERLTNSGGRSLAFSLRAQSRMTLTPTKTRGSEQSNAIPSLATLVCDSRTLPGQGRKELEKILKTICKGIEGLRIKIHEHNPSSASPLDPARLEQFSKSATFALGQEAEAVPYWCPGATDAHWVRSLGTPVYGFQLITPRADPDRLGIHCVDESIEEQMLLPCALSLGHLALSELHEN